MLMRLSMFGLKVPHTRLHKHDMGRPRTSLFRYAQYGRHGNTGLGMPR